MLHVGLETSAYIAMMNQHFDCLRPLVLFVKHVLLCEGLISPYNGGISSYTLVGYGWIVYHCATKLLLDLDPVHTRCSRYRI